MEIKKIISIAALVALMSSQVYGAAAGEENVQRVPSLQKLTARVVMTLPGAVVLNQNGRKLTLELRPDIDITEDARELVNAELGKLNTLIQPCCDSVPVFWDAWHACGESTELSWLIPVFMDGDANVDEALSQAASYGYTEVARLAIERGANIEMVDECKDTPLSCAARFGYPKIVNLLLGARAQVNVQGDLNLTPLHGAVQVGDSKSVDLLIKAGAKVDCRAARMHNWTPLVCAVRGRSPQRDRAGIIIRLLKSGANPNEVVSEEEETILMNMIQEGHTGIVEQLIACAADVNARNNEGETGLDYAISKNNIEIVCLLLNAGASVNPERVFEWRIPPTPLEQAISKNNAEMVQLLVDAGALEGANERTVERVTKVLGG